MNEALVSAHAALTAAEKLILSMQGERNELLDLLRLLHGRSGGPDKLAIEQVLDDGGKARLFRRQRMVCFVRDWLDDTLTEAIAEEVRTGYPAFALTGPFVARAREILVDEGMDWYKTPPTGVNPIG